MNFISFEFIVLFPLILLLYWIIPGKARCRFLLLVSYGFYCYWNPWMVVLLLGTTLVSYVAAINMSKFEDIKKRKRVLIFALVICFGILFIFKYFGFFAYNVGTLLKFLHIAREDWIVEILLPVGISFYTFQTASYVIDVYRGKIQPEEHFGFYALYVSFFSQLVAGPIERPENLLPQLHRTKELKSDNQNLVYGLLIMARGYIKKVVIADYVAIFVDKIFSNAADSKGIFVIVGATFFAIQIYCDFSGYSDIAVGVARMLGIHLMENFKIPYKADSIREFWKRWHISLTSWFTDYVYIPLGGNRVSEGKIYRNLLIVFLLSGAWHGAAWNYVVWGAIHGVYLCVETRCKILRKKTVGVSNFDTENRNESKRWFYIARTFLLVCLAWIFFRAENLSDAFVLVGNIGKGWSFSAIEDSIAMLEINLEFILRIIVSVAVLTLLDKMTFPKEKWNMNLQKAREMSLLIFEMILIIGIGWLVLLARNADSTFIYFQF